MTWGTVSLPGHHGQRQQGRSRRCPAWPGTELLSQHDALVPGQQGLLVGITEAGKEAKRASSLLPQSPGVLCLCGSSREPCSKQRAPGQQAASPGCPQPTCEPRPCVSQAESMRQLYPLLPSHQHQIPKNKLHLLTPICFLLFKTMHKCDLRRLVTGSNRASSRLKSSAPSP